MDLPPELIEQVLLHLSTVDLGNLAMTCRRMRDWLDPELSSRLKRLVWADPNIVQLVRPQQPEAFGITQRDQLASDDLQEAEALDVREDLRSFTEDLYACPMLAKYVKHVFIDYRKLSSVNYGFTGFEDVEHVEQLMRSFKLGESTIHDHASSFWMSECGLAAMVLLKFTGAESLVLVGCNSHGFDDHRDPITTALSVARTPECQQKRLRSLRYIYAWGCMMKYGKGHAPWEFVILPSVKSLECQEVCGPLPVVAGPYEDYILRRAPECGRGFHLESLVVRQQALNRESFFTILKHTPHLKRLSYQCIAFGKGRMGCSRGLRLAKLRNAIQTLSECLEELTIEVESIQDLWCFFYDYRGHGPDDVVSDDGHSLYDDNVEEDDGEDQDNSEDEGIDETEGMDWSSLNEEAAQLKERYGDHWSYHDLRNLQDVPFENIHASLDRLSRPWVEREPSWNDQQPEFLGSLAHFKKLKNVTVPAIVLQDPWPYPRHTREMSATVYSDGTAVAAGAKKHLKDLLPKTIERLTLLKLEGKSSPCAGPPFFCLS